VVKLTLYVLLIAVICIVLVVILAVNLVNSMACHLIMSMKRLSFLNLMDEEQAWLICFLVVIVIVTLLVQMMLLWIKLTMKIMDNQIYLNPL